MIYPILKSDNVVQVGELITFDATTSFKTPDESDFTAVEIQPEASAPFFALDVTDKSNWTLPFVYETSGDKVVTCRITNATGSAIKSMTVSVKTKAEEKLFCEDNDLVPQESDILKWIPRNRSTYNFIHRRVQQRIMNEIDKLRIVDVNRNRITLDHVLDTSEFRDWAIYMALAMIFQGISNQTDDIFSEKSIFYEKKQLEHMGYALNKLRLDFNNDGQITKEDEKDFRSSTVWKR